MLQYVNGATDNELLMYKNKLLQEIDKLLQKYND